MYVSVICTHVQEEAAMNERVVYDTIGPEIPTHHPQALPQ